MTEEQSRKLTDEHCEEQDWKIDYLRQRVVFLREMCKRQVKSRIKATADNLRLQERVRELEDKYRHIHVGPDRICATCGKDITDNLHARHKETT